MRPIDNSQKTISVLYERTFFDKLKDYLSVKDIVNFSTITKRVLGITGRYTEGPMIGFPRDHMFFNRYGPLVRSLNFRSYGDEEIMRKIPFFPNVTAVNLSFNRQVTDAGIQVIKETYPDLKYLNVKGCVQLETVGTLAIYGDL